MKRSRVIGGAGLAVALLASTGVVSAHSGIDLISDGAIDNAKDTHAHDAQHDDVGGHLPATSSGPIEVVSELAMSRVTDGGIADVAVHGDYAYLNSWGGAGNCGRNGTHVVDISDVENPVEVAFINSKEGSYPGEGAQVLSMSTPSFTGDVLLTNNELCKTGVGFGGINLYDVTDPTDPRNLSLGFGDYDDGKNRKKSANQVHSVFGWQDGQKAYAVMVDNEELTDVDIVDITNPRKPKLIAEHDLQALFKVAEGDPGLSEVFLHDMVVKEIDGTQVMLLSYWDGGYVTLDVDDPAKPKLMADSEFGAVDSLPADGKPVPPEGNAHQAEFTLDDELVIAADEDFSPYALLAANTTDGTDLTASPGSDTPPLVPGQPISGTAVFVGRACPGDAPVPGVPGTVVGPAIAVVERGVCAFTEKVTSVAATGGYAAILIFNRTAADGCESSLGMTVEGGIPTFGVAPRSQGFAIFGAAYDEAACLAGDGTQLSGIPLGAVGDALTFNEYFDGWGFVRLLDADTMTEIDAYAIPESRSSAYATNSGDLSVHEVATSRQHAGLAYLSYYAGGVRVIEVDATTGITEVASFIDEGGNNFWGIEAFERDGVEYFAASDRDKGLYIFKYTP